MLEKAFYRAEHVLFPQNDVTQVSPVSPAILAMSLQWPPKPI